jgi:hypothetical protein
VETTTVEELRELLEKALEIGRDATMIGHYEHWDATMRGGRGCPACRRVQKLREELDILGERARALEGQ